MSRQNLATGLELTTQPELEPRAFHVFAHEDEGNMDEESPRISIATDASLDEGAIIRTDAHDGGSPFGGPVQYFVGLDYGEAEIVLAALDAFTTDDYTPEELETVRGRVQRLATAIRS